MRGTPTHEALQGAITAFRAAGCDTPRLDAELLLAHVLGVSRERLLIDRDRELVGDAVRDFQQAVRRRAMLREPVAYITGLRAFRHIELNVDHRVLIPRPETELLVQVALELSDGASVVDVCTGSGAVALALAHERPDLRVTGSDISEDALEVAVANGRKLGVDVSWHRADLLEGLADEYHAVLANPPYIADGERGQLAAEITHHEPALALFAGADGLEVLTRLIDQASRRSAVGLIALEIGAGQAARTAQMMRTSGFANIAIHSDLAGIERVVVGSR